jgi:polysaccharide export outer membrane protein
VSTAATGPSAGVTIFSAAAPVAQIENTSPEPVEKPITDVVESTFTFASSPAAVKTLDTFEKTSKNVAEDYLIDNSDILGITVYPSDELSREVVVQPDGNITFPLIGAVQAKGLTVKKLEAKMAQSLSRYVSSPQISITVKQFSRRQVFITGEVKGVGAYNYKDNLRLLEFISSIGGFNDTANRTEVKIYRGPPTQRQIHLVNVAEIVKTGDFSKDFMLEPGDIIEVQKGQAKISILGDIRSPGYYDYKENMKLIDLVSLAGGFNDSAKITEVSIIHQINDNERTTKSVNFKKILSGKDKDAPLYSGDTVYFPKGKMESANYFVNTILPWLTLITLVIAIKGGI